MTSCSRSAGSGYRQRCFAIGLAIALLLGTGCSFSLRGPDENRRHDEAPRCSTSKGLVVLDGLAVAVLGIMTIAAAANSEAQLAAVAGVTGVVFAAGAVRGNGRVDKCREAEIEHRSWLAGQTRRNADVATREREVDVDVEPPVPAIPKPIPVKPRQVPPPEPVVAPPSPAAPAPAKSPRTSEEQFGDDEWGDFWQEVP